jgi:integrase
MARPRTPINAHGDITIQAIKRIPCKGQRTLLRVINPKQEKPDTYRARTWYRHEDGRLRQIERFGKSEAKARATLLHALTQIDDGATVNLSKTTTLASLANRFLQTKSEGHTTLNTYGLYKRTIDKLINPRIGALSVTEATPERLQNFLYAITKENGPASAKSCRSVLSGMLGMAVRNGVIQRNPVRELERIKQRPQGAKALSSEDLTTLLHKVRNDQRLHELDLVDVIEFMAGTGCRVGEALALTWRKVNLEHTTATIGATVFRIPKQGLIRQDHGKTESSQRTITLPTPVTHVLAARRARNVSNNDLVFPTTLGNLRDPQNTERDWRQARTRLGLGPVKLHAFRKTVATLLDQAGLSARDIAEYLGHKNPSMTQDKYMSKTAGTSKVAAAMSQLTEIDSGSNLRGFYGVQEKEPEPKEQKPRNHGDT